MGFFDSSSSSTNNNTQNYDQRQVNTQTDSNNVFEDQSVSTVSTVTNLLDGGAVALAGGVASMAGAVATTAIGLSAQTTQTGLEYADSIFSGATKYSNGVNDHMADAYSQAATLQNDALTGARAAYQNATNAVSSAWGSASDMTMAALKLVSGSAAAAQTATADAYADAKGTTNSQKQIIIGVLVVAGIMALAMMQKKAG